jgi:hypothetical protein
MSEVNDVYDATDCQKLCQAPSHKFKTHPQRTAQTITRAHCRLHAVTWCELLATYAKKRLPFSKAARAGQDHHHFSRFSFFISAAVKLQSKPQMGQFRSEWAASRQVCLIPLSIRKAPYALPNPARTRKRSGRDICLWCSEKLDSYWRRALENEFGCIKRL